MSEVDKVLSQRCGVCRHSLRSHSTKGCEGCRCAEFFYPNQEVNLALLVEQMDEMGIDGPLLVETNGLDGPIMTNPNERTTPRPSRVLCLSFRMEFRAYNDQPPSSRKESK